MAKYRGVCSGFSRDGKSFTGAKNSLLGVFIVVVELGLILGGIKFPEACFVVR